MFYHRVIPSLKSSVARDRALPDNRGKNTHLYQKRICWSSWNKRVEQSAAQSVCQWLLRQLDRKRFDCQWCLQLHNWIKNHNWQGQVQVLHVVTLCARYTHNQALSDCPVTHCSTSLHALSGSTLRLGCKSCNHPSPLPAVNSQSPHKCQVCYKHTQLLSCQWQFSADVGEN